MKRHINLVNLTRCSLSVMLGLVLLWMGVTKVYLYYVTPRTLPYLYFAALLLLVMGGYSFTQRHAYTHVQRFTPLLVLLIPLLLLLFSTYDANLWRAPLFPLANDTSSDLSIQQETYSMTMAGYEGHVLHGYNAQTKSIDVTEAETYYWLSEIYTDPTPFLDYTVRTMGQVLSDPEYFTPGCFSPTRQLMTCCVSDLYTIGFKCQYDHVPLLTDGDWVAVTGTLQMVDLATSQELRLIVDTVTPCNPPTDPYVYAY